MTTYQVEQYDVGKTKVEADSFERVDGDLTFFAGTRKVAAFSSWISVIELPDHLTTVK